MKAEIINIAKRLEAGQITIVYAKKQLIKLFEVEEPQPANELCENCGSDDLIITSTATICKTCKTKFLI